MPKRGESIKGKDQLFEPYFVLDWGQHKYSNQILIESIMNGTAGLSGISFTLKREVIRRHLKK
jgi:hypothetical protein